jgi:hypothetical protein
VEEYILRQRRISVQKILLLFGKSCLWRVKDIGKSKLKENPFKKRDNFSLFSKEVKKMSQTTLISFVRPFIDYLSL